MTPRLTTDPTHAPSRWRPIVRRFLAGAFIAGYLCATAAFLALHALGDWGVHPISYFFTWDMFPSFYYESSRRVAVGRTANGRFIQLHPDPSQQFRGGVHGDLTRVDLDRSGASFRGIVEQTLRRNEERQRLDPIIHVDLFERYWPEKFNLPDDLYERWWGTPHPHRSYWRIREEFDVSASLPPDNSPPGSGVAP